MFDKAWTGDWLVREISKPNAWLGHKTSSAEELLKTFTLSDDQPVSVYRVSSDVQEARVAAALGAGRDVSVTTPQHLLRIPQSRLPESMKLEDEQRGGTDIPDVDGQHRNLVGSQKAWLDLINSLIEQIRLGADLHRAVCARALGHHWQQIYSATPNDAKRRRIQRYLDQLKLTAPKT